MQMHTAIDDNRFTQDNTLTRCRLDKWLWAARFFRTRSLAQAAVEGGKVHYQGQRVKSGHAVRVGAVLEVRSGLDVHEIEVLQLSEQRGPASTARLLYRETAASLARRAAAAEQRRLAPAPDPGTRPDKRQREALRRLQRS